MKPIIHYSRVIFLFLCTYNISLSQTSQKADSLKTAFESTTSKTQKAHILVCLGEELFDKGKIQQSFDTYQQALKKYQALQSQSGIAKSWVGMAIALGVQSDYKKAIDYLNKALKKFKSLDERSKVAECYLEIGKYVSYQGKYQEAIDYYYKAMSYGEGIIKVRAYQNMGVDYRNFGKYQKALEAHFKAYELSQKYKILKGEAYSLNSIGRAYEKQGKYTLALEYSFKALEINEKRKAPQGIAYDYDNIADVYFALEDFSKALSYYRKALSIRKKSGDQRETAIGYAHIGKIYRKQKKNKQAIRSFNQSLQIAKKIGFQSGVAASLEALGNMAMEVDRDYPKAQELLEKSLKLRQLLKERATTAAVSVSLGNALYYQQKTQKALLFINRGVQEALKVREPSIVRDGAKMLAKIYQNQGNFKSAYRNHVLFKQMTDSLKNEVIAKNVARITLTTRFQREKDSLKFAQDKALLASRIKLEKEKSSRLLFQNLVVFILLGFVGTVVFAFFTFRSRQRQKRLNKIMALQKHNLEVQSNELLTLNEELKQSQDEVIAQRNFIEEQNHRLRDSKRRTDQSIQAAYNIQQAILPFEEQMQSIFARHFVLYRPRDVVSGDFYWIEKVGNKTFAAVVDCTGHGVPGAFMSMIGNTLLDRLIKIQQIHNPGQALEMMNQEVRRMLHQENSKDSNGMDMIICMLEGTPESDVTKVTFAGAKRPMYYIKSDEPEVKLLKGTNKAIGGIQRADISFANQSLYLQQGSVIYLCSDGYVDQNNPHRKKIGIDKFQQLLIEAQQYTLAEQRTFFERYLNEHMQDAEQRDDILLIGFEL